MPPSPSLSPLNFFNAALKTFASTSSNAFTILRNIPSTAQSTPSPKRLIILDSSFNPPTTAHLAMVTSALRSYASDASSTPESDGIPADARVLLLLSVENADKKPKPASFAHRLCMMEALASHIYSSSLTSVDIGVAKQPYFHEKSAAIASSGAYSSDTQQTFLAGYDTLIRILNPKYYPEGMQTSLDPFFERAKLRVVMRTDGDWGGVEEQKSWVKGLKEGEEDWGGKRHWLKERVDIVEGFGDGVSSSRVRELVSGGKGGWEAMVPKHAGRHIRDQGLYTGDLEHQ